MKIQHYIILTCIASVLIAFQTSAQTKSYLADPGSGPREHAIDIERMSLEVSFIPEKGLVKGKVTHVFRLLQDSISTLFFDGPGITIKEALFNGKLITFDTSGTGVTVRFKETLKRKEIRIGNSKLMPADSIVFTYEASPRKGIYFIGWNSEKNKSSGSVNNYCAARKQIWTQGQGIDNRYWIPMYDDMDDKMISETSITFDKDYQVLSNGSKISEKLNTDGTKTWHYKMTHPHSSYLVMIGIGKYNIKTSKSSTGVKMNSYYYPEFPNRLETTYRYTEKMMDFLERETGTSYPWESYSQIPVQDFIYGAMENTTATVFGDFLQVDSFAFNDRSYVGVNAHEMTHQWFGDYVTARSSKNTWLQESFATHYSKHFKRLVYGEDEYQWERRNELNSVLNAAKTDRNPIVHTKAGSARVYPKGSLVLDMLRYVLGEDQYKRGLNLYLKRNAYANVDTHDFQKAFEDALGLNLDWFFEEWLYKGSEPQYEISWRDVIINPERIPTGEGQTIFSYGGEQTEITIQQTHLQDELTGLYKMPVIVQVYYKDGTMDEKKEIVEKQTQVINVANPLGKQVEFVIFDPGAQIIKTVSYPRSMQQLKSQAMKSKNMIDRYDAVVAMRDSSFDIKKNILTEIFNQKISDASQTKSTHSEFYAIKHEILSQLSDDEDLAAVALFKNALSDQDIRVRRSAVLNTKKIDPSLQKDFEKELVDSSYEIIVSALEKLCTQYPENIAHYLDQTKNIFGMGNTVRCKWIEWQFTKGNKTFLPELIEMCGNGYEFRTRVNAFNTLEKLNYLDESVVKNLFDAILSWNNRLAGPASEVTNYFYKQNEQKNVIQKYYRSQKWSQREKAILEKYGE